MSDVTDRTKFAWPVVIVVATVALAAGGVYAKVMAQDDIDVKQGVQLTDHERRITKTEDAVQYIKDWMERHDK